MDSTQGIVGTRTFGWDSSWHQGLIRDSNSGFRNDGPVAVLVNCLNGVGDTMIPLLASPVTMRGLQLPLVVFLPREANLGVYGVCWAMVIALAMRALTYIFYFRLGRWKRKEL